MAAADAAIHPHFELVAHGIDNRRQRGNRRGGPVQLAATVVADHNRIGAVVGGQHGIFHFHDAFQNQLAAPLLFNPAHVFPGQARVELLIGPRGQGVHVRHALHMPDQVAEGVAARAGHA